MDDLKIKSKGTDIQVPLKLIGWVVAVIVIAVLIIFDVVSPINIWLEIRRFFGK